MSSNLPRTEMTAGQRVVDEFSRSSVKLNKNAKGELQQEVKVYEGADQVEIERIMGVALSVYRLLDKVSDASAAQVASIARPEDR